MFHGSHCIMERSVDCVCFSVLWKEVFIVYVSLCYGKKCWLCVFHCVMEKSVDCVCFIVLWKEVLIVCVFHCIMERSVDCVCFTVLWKEVLIVCVSLYYGKKC